MLLKGQVRGFMVGGLSDECKLLRNDAVLPGDWLVGGPGCNGSIVGSG